MLAKKTFKSQFIWMFIFIIVSSIIATLVTYAAGYIIYVSLASQKMTPANYYEQQMDKLDQLIRNKGAELMKKDAQSFMERLVPEEGVFYQVVGLDGEVIYGSSEKHWIEGREDLYSKVNTTLSEDGQYARIVPLFSPEGRLEGAVSLAYKLEPRFASTTDKLWISLLFLGVLFSPFIYTILFTLLFATRFANSISKPVNLLIEAAQKVRDKNLDFHIEYEADNELGKLCQSFNQMGTALKESLLTQWKIEQERNEMIQALAHDLKTPLAVIQGYAEALMGVENDRQIKRRYLQVIKEHAQKGGELVKTMLYVAELESSGEELHPVPVDLAAFLSRKKESYEVMAKHKKITVSVEIVPQNMESASCQLDQEKLERILDNIVQNSIRYTPEGGTITISAEVRDVEVVFTVSDTGPGFSRQDLPHLFDKFYKGDPSRSSKSGHAGLGLYIAHQLVNLHGGKIKAENEENGGARVTFSLKRLTGPSI